MTTAFDEFINKIFVSRALYLIILKKFFIESLFSIMITIYLILYLNNRFKFRNTYKELIQRYIIILV